MTKNLCNVFYCWRAIGYIQFLKIIISQVSVATRFRCGRIFNDSFIAKFTDECSSE